MATARQERAFNLVVANGGNVSKAMRKAKYSPKTAKTPQKLTESKGWEELLNIHMSERALMKAGSEGLKSTLIKFTPEGEQLKVPDFNARHKYFESGLKLRGKLQNNETPGATNNFFINKLTIGQQRRLAQEIIDAPEESTGEFNSISDSNEPEL